MSLSATDLGHVLGLAPEYLASYATARPNAGREPLELEFRRLARGVEG
jgi:hypothetical protein